MDKEIRNNAQVRLSKHISIYMIQGCFLALMTVLSPFGFYTDGHQQIIEPTRTELVEEDYFQTKAPVSLVHVTIEVPEQHIDFSYILAHENIQVK